ncbi:MAG: glycosyltransferase family 2 protein [candidate division Zixibacteria bacterium]|nr:glycosyltransferase family 2 protein [candidate division Zixibacteria bacterium]
MGGLETAYTFAFREDINIPSLRLSIVIVSYNVKEELSRCLTSLTSGTDPLNDCEIIVVDNNSGDGTRQMLRDAFPRIQRLENTCNIGYARGANQGIAKSSGEHILLLNPDTIARLDQINKLVDIMKSQIDVGILGSKVVGKSGERQFSARNFPGFAVYFSNAQSWLNRIRPKNRWSRRYLGKDLDSTMPTETDWVSGSAMLIKRELIKSIGGFDSKYFMYVEDVDICRRARSAGWKVLYCPEIEITHYSGRSTSQKKFKMLAEHHKSMYYYFHKYYRINALIGVVVVLGIWLRLGTVTLSHWLRN